ncbi:MAG: chitobiase/beta-hexosaminidase C-terminal domain-containing protein [Bacteroidaceae bacterium]|nr:chitobiase/beta-hexosaminidase C-terminal domain-containing protein [Bacteroidaceae bacterium]
MTLTQNDADMIMYTTDGTDPSYENNVGKVYSEAITITESTTIKAIAVDADENVSEIATFAFIVADPNAVTAINTIDFSTFGLTNGELFSTCTSGDVTVNFTDGSTATAYYTTGTGIRTYGGGSITVSAGGKDITSIVMTFASGNVPSASDLDGWNISGTTATWNGSATEVTISRPTGSGHWRLQTVKVEYTTANYTREVTVGDFGTVCLPFGVDAEGIKGATFYTVSSKTMDGDDVKSISLEPVTSLTAGVGYIFEATASTVTLKSNGTSASAPVDGVMKGSFTSYVQIPNDMYIVRGTKILKTSDDYGYVGAYRAYIDLSSVATGEAKGRVIYAEGNDATGIQSIEGKAAQDVYYNLNGQRVVQPVKGIYIVNGKKVLVK